MFSIVEKLTLSSFVVQVARYCSAFSAWYIFAYEMQIREKTRGAYFHSDEINERPKYSFPMIVSINHSHI